MAESHSASVSGSCRLTVMERAIVNIVVINTCARAAFPARTSEKKSHYRVTIRDDDASAPHAEAPRAPDL